ITGPGPDIAVDRGAVGIGEFIVAFAEIDLAIDSAFIADGVVTGARGHIIVDRSAGGVGELIIALAKIDRPVKRAGVVDIIVARTAGYAATGSLGLEHFKIDQLIVDREVDNVVGSAAIEIQHKGVGAISAV